MMAMEEELVFLMTDTNHLKFIDSEFICCTLNRHGDAVALSNNKNKTKQIPTFTRCYFENNQAG